jgi:hypothetical protein
MSSASRRAPPSAALSFPAGLATLRRAAFPASKKRPFGQKSRQSSRRSAGRAPRQAKSRKKPPRFARPARSPQVVSRKGLNAGACGRYGNPLKIFPTPAVKTVASPQFLGRVGREWRLVCHASGVFLSPILTSNSKRNARSRVSRQIRSWQVRDRPHFPPSPPSIRSILF